MPEVYDPLTDPAPAHDLRAVLRIRAFRRLWIAFGLSSLGDWIGLLALTAMAKAFAGDDYQAANFAIGGVLFLRVLPALVMGPVAGWVADRLDRRWTMIIGDLIRAAFFVTIPIVGTLTWLLIATVLIEVVSLIWGPAKDASVPNLVPRHRLEAANQLSLITTYGSALPAAVIFTAITLVTRGLGDFSIDLAVYVNAATFLVSGLAIVSIAEIGRSGTHEHEEHPTLWRTMVEGWSYVTGTPVIRGLVVGISGAFAAGAVVIGLGRTYVEDLHAGDPGYGVLFGAVFGGLALGMGFAPRLFSGLSRRRLFAAGLVGSGIGLAGLALIQQIEIATMIAVVLGFCAGASWVSGYTLLGLEVPDNVRGRTFAFVQSAVRTVLAVTLAVAPFIAGAIGRRTWSIGDHSVSYNGAALTMLIAAVLAGVIGLIAWRQMDDRPGVPFWRDLRRSFGKSPGVYPTTGLFIALEGGEGAGKSTQSALLVDWLQEQGQQVLLTREPGATDLGKTLRQIVLDPATGDISHRAEALHLRRGQGRTRGLGDQARAEGRCRRHHRPVRRFRARLPGIGPGPGSRRRRAGEPLGHRRPPPEPDDPAGPAAEARARPVRGAGPDRGPVARLPRAGPDRVPGAGGRRAAALPGPRRDPGTRAARPQIRARLLPMLPKVGP